MATRLENYVSHGSISNEIPGKITGEIWLIGADEPIALELEGNPHADLAGTRLIFEHCEPELDEGETVPEMALMQRGIAGDVTGSKRVYHREKILDDPDSNGPRLVNSLCIEWYDAQGDRFVIDSASFYLYAGERIWEMDAETERAQLLANTERFQSFIERIANRMTDTDRSAEDEDEDLRPLDEFQWEQRLQESDRITKAYSEAIDKYQDLPDQENLVAAAMGFDSKSETENDHRWSPAEEESDGDDFLDFDELDPDAWLSSDDTDFDSHPLYQRAQAFSSRLLSEAQDLSLLDDDDDDDSISPAQTLVFASMDLSTKLAGALNGVAHSDPEPGLVVAWLKRGLPIVDRALAGAESAHAQGSAPKDWIEAAKKELFEIRAGMLDLIQEYRSQLP